MNTHEMMSRSKLSRAPGTRNDRHKTTFHVSGVELISGLAVPIPLLKMQMKDRIKNRQKNTSKHLG